jgi:hypothetical protein
MMEFHDKTTFGIATGWDAGLDWSNTQRENYVRAAQNLLAKRGSEQSPPEMYFSMARWLFEATEDGRRRALHSIVRNIEALEHLLREAREGIAKPTERNL